LFCWEVKIVYLTIFFVLFFAFPRRLHVQMYLLVKDVLRCTEPQAQQMVRQMFGMGGQRAMIDQNGDGQISFPELWTAIQNDRPQGLQQMLISFVQAGLTNGGGGMGGGMGGGNMGGGMGGGNMGGGMGGGNMGGGMMGGGMMGGGMMGGGNGGGMMGGGIGGRGGGGNNNQPCRNWTQNGQCQHGRGCRFAHDPQARGGRGGRGGRRRPNNNRNFSNNNSDY
jgi:hypothetical protein